MSDFNKNRLNRLPGRASISTLLFFVSLSLASRVSGQTPQSAHVPDALHQLNDSVEALVQRVSPSVVQVLVSGYSSTEDTDQGQMSVVIGKQRTIGSGVIVDPEGYIVTNAHVVKGAEKIEVTVTRPSTGDGIDGIPATAGQTFEGRVIGVATRFDLAVIKIEAHNLPTLQIRKPVKPRQGEIVFAFGSPEG